MGTCELIALSTVFIRLHVSGWWTFVIRMGTCERMMNICESYGFRRADDSIQRLHSATCEWITEIYESYGFMRVDNGNLWIVWEPASWSRCPQSSFGYMWADDEHLWFVWEPASGWWTFVNRMGLCIRITEICDSYEFMRVDQGIQSLHSATCEWITDICESYE